MELPTEWAVALKLPPLQCQNMLNNNRTVSSIVLTIVLSGVGTIPAEP